MSFATDARASDIGVAFALMTRGNPEHVHSMSAYATRIWDELERDGLDPVQGVLVRSAADGVYYNEMVGNPSIPEPLRSDLRTALIHMTYPNVT